MINIQIFSFRVSLLSSENIQNVTTYKKKPGVLAVTVRDMNAEDFSLPQTS